MRALSPRGREWRRTWLFALATTALTIALAGLAPLGCAGDGAEDPAKKKKKKRTILSTVFDDRQVGEDAAKEIEAEMGVYGSDALTKYVNEVGRRLAPHAPPQPFQYKFQIIDQMAPNAFALPGGHIYVSRGLLALAGTEDELAGVLGHEIIHAAERHAARQQQLMQRTSPFLLPWVRVARLAAYSQDSERSADRGGQEIAARAGYDPGALTTFLERLRDSERLELGYSRLTSYFSTHPGTTERVASTAADASTLRLDGNFEPRETDSAGYLHRIDGVVLGNDPREGIFRDSEFIHPDMSFRILFPRGWELLNTHRAVGGVSPDHLARIFLTAGPGSVPIDEEGNEISPDDRTLPGKAPRRREISAKEAADRFLSDHTDDFEARATRSQPIRIGEIDAHRLEVVGRLGRTSVTGQITFIPHNGLMFRLTGIAQGGAWSSFVGRARATARSFRPLSEPERHSVPVIHLRVVHALEGEDVASVSYRTGNAWSPSQTAVLNGVFVNKRFAAGDLVKVARSSAYTPANPREVRERLISEGAAAESPPKARSDDK